MYIEQKKIGFFKFEFQQYCGSSKNASNYKITSPYCALIR